MKFKFCFCLTVVVFLSLAIETVVSQQKPNVVLIMTDDQGYGDFGATGNQVIQTPNIDQMAKNSALLTHFYVSPVCSPTRACLMTGRYNYRTRCIDTWIGRSMMEPSETTIAEILSAAGYQTGIFGKWHLGDCYPMRPNDQGFKESLIHKGGGLAQPSEPIENNRRYTDPILFRNGKQVKTKGYCTDVYFDAAIEFIKQSHRREKPFFTYIATNAPHGPYHDVPPKLLAEYLKKQPALQSIMRGKKKKNAKQAVDQLARIAAMITNVDQNVGKLRKTLDTLGISDNTLIIFMVDNGPNTMRYVDRFRGMKTNVHEGGIRSPAWFHWPSKLRLRKVRQMTAHIDIMPTILRACDVETPENVKLDGRNLMPLLTGAKIKWPKRNIVIQTHRGNQPVKYHHFMICDGRWKLVHPSGFHRETFQGQPRFELYDLASDPGEQKNQFDTQPKIAQRLKTDYERWFADVSSTRENNYAPPRIVLGNDAETTTVLTRQDWRTKPGANRGIGLWKVELENSTTFDVDVVLLNNVSAGAIKLQCGNRKIATKFSSVKNRRVLIENVTLAAGKHDLQCIVNANDKSIGAYQLILKRRK